MSEKGKISKEKSGESVVVACWSKKLKSNHVKGLQYNSNTVIQIKTYRMFSLWLQFQTKPPPKR